MNLIYGIKDKPKFGQMLVFAFQQVLAILAATIAVPAIVGNGMSAAAALFGAGVGTIIYQLFLRFHQFHAGRFRRCRFRFRRFCRHHPGRFPGWSGVCRHRSGR